MRRSLTLLSLGLAVFAVAAVQDSVVLRRDLKPGMTDTYTITYKGTQNLDVPGMGAQDVTLDGSMLYALTVDKIDEKGIADAKITVSEVKLQAGGSMGEMVMGQMPAMPEKMETKVRMDGRLRVLETVGVTDQRLAMLGTSSMGFAFGLDFPEQEVKAGDSWDVTVPKNPFMGKEEQKLKATLVGAKEQDGKAFWEIKVAGTLNTDIDMAEAMKAMGTADAGGMNMRMKGAQDIETVAWVEKGTGRLLRMDMTSKSKMTMDLVDMGMTIPIGGTLTSSMVLK